MHLLRAPRRVVLGSSASLFVTAVLTGCGGAAENAEPDVGAAPSEEASAVVETTDLVSAAQWLAGEVGPNGFVKGQYVDHGLTLDYAVALSRLGGHDDAVTRILDAMQDEQEVAGYVSFYDEKKNGQYAGATAKLLDTVVAADRDPSDYRSDLVTDLEDMLVEGGPEAGRAKDTGKTDYSNSISQAYVVRALAATGQEGPLQPAVGFLLSQQCEEGWFRESMTGADGEFSCEDGPAGDRSASVDATAHAIQALLQLDGTLDGELAGAAEQATARAVDWLESAQGPDGGYSVAGGSDQPNANSTGLAAAALDAAGRGEPAELAAQWLLDYQVTEATGPLAGQLGAEAFDDRTLAKARKQGIKPADRYIWQRATVEAALGLQGVATEE